MSDDALVALLAPHLDADARRDACRALALWGDARMRVLSMHRAGPRLLAALELGRRAALRELAGGPRVRGVTDAARLAGPLVTDDVDARALLVLDARMRLVTAHVLARATPSAVWRRVLSAGGSRAVLARRAAGVAVPTAADVDDALAIARAAVLVDGALLDVLVIGDDRVASLAHLGLVPRSDVRWA